MCIRDRLKPTYGAVSRYGLVAFASSLDQIGPLGRTVDDVALLYGAICGHDPRDATSKNAALGAVSGEVKGLRLGVPKEYFGEGVSAEVKAAVYAAVERLKGLGAEVVEVSLPSTDYALAAYYIISSAEASSCLLYTSWDRRGGQGGDSPSDQPVGPPGYGDHYDLL